MMAYFHLAYNCRQKGVFMAEIKVVKRGSRLIIECEYDREGSPSASGKTTVHCTTHGNVPVVIDGRTHYLGLNVYTR